jgi:hypothetical protein
MACWLMAKKRYDLSEGGVGGEGVQHRGEGSQRQRADLQWS